MLISVIKTLSSEFKKHVHNKYISMLKINLYDRRIELTFYLFTTITKTNSIGRTDSISFEFINTLVEYF